MVLENVCQLQVAERYWPIGEKKEEKLYLHRSYLRPFILSWKEAFN